MTASTDSLVPSRPPVMAQELAESMRDLELPVRVIDGDTSRVIRLPIGRWSIVDCTAVRSLVEALGWRLLDDKVQNDPDGCVLVLGRSS